jgi:CDP-diacylglycerol--glycerol-3-phosphate 3-phosphatidyltransferase
MAIQFQLDALRHETPTKRTSLVLPDALVALVLRSLDSAARVLVRLGASANAITSASIALGALGGVLLAFGQFGPAAIAMVIASLGDALDGLVARRSGSSSVAGALLDASGDRYQEFFFLGGLAVFFRESVGALVLTLLALVGSFMVSYGSAKAEALGVPVPPGVMRRAERAACLCTGAVFTPAFAWFARRSGLAAWCDPLPLLASLALIAVVANASAVRRLHSLARNSSPASPVARREGRPPADVVRIGGFREERKTKKAPATGLPG